MPVPYTIGEEGDQLIPVVVRLTKKLDPSRRDLFNRYVPDPEEQNFRSIDNADDSDEDQIGRRASFTVELTREAINAFRNEAGNVASVEPDQIMRKILEPDDEEAIESTKKTTFDTLPHGITDDVMSLCEISQAYNYGYRGARTVVGVADTGYDHANYGAWIGEQWEGEWTAFADGVDRDGHGTWCGAAALAWDAYFYNVKVLGDDGSGTLSGVAAGMWAFYRHMASVGKRGVLSMSLGGSGYSAEMEEAARFGIKNGVVTVAAAGNSGPNRGTVGTPGNLPSVMTVGAWDHWRSLMAYFSSRDPFVELIAPGVQLQGVNGVKSGTSMATPIVAKAVACLIGAAAPKLQGLTDVQGDVTALSVFKATPAGATCSLRPVIDDGHGLLRTVRALRKLGIVV